MQNIIRYDRKNDSFINAKETGTTTSCILQDTDDNIWFATLGKGLYSFKPGQGEWKQYTFSPDDAFSAGAHIKKRLMYILCAPLPSPSAI